jgi:hypothetical protein
LDIFRGRRMCLHYGSEEEFHYHPKYIHSILSWYYKCLSNILINNSFLFLTFFCSKKTYRLCKSML